MFQVYDVVLAKESLSSFVPKGTLGTVLLIYNCGSEYEVEFINSASETLDILTVQGNKLCLKKR